MQLMRHFERDQGSKRYTKQTHCARLLNAIADKSPIRSADDKLLVNFNARFACDIVGEIGIRAYFELNLTAI